MIELELIPHMFSHKWLVEMCRRHTVTERVIYSNVGTPFFGDVDLERDAPNKEASFRVLFSHIGTEGRAAR